MKASIIPRILQTILALTLISGASIALVGTGLASPAGSIETAQAKTLPKSQTKLAYDLTKKLYKSGFPSGLKVSGVSKNITVKWNAYKKTYRGVTIQTGYYDGQYQVQVINTKTKKTQNFWVRGDKTSQKVTLPSKGTYTIKVRALHPSAISKWATKKITIK